jgi:hypothetical protein
MKLLLTLLTIISATRAFSQITFDAFNQADVLDLSQDPVKLLVSLDPSLEKHLNEPRLIQIAGAADQQPEWLVEGDKLRLRREGIHFRDLTGAEDILGGRRLTEKGPVNEGK